jgi:hypothetical protein
VGRVSVCADHGHGDGACDIREDFGRRDRDGACPDSLVVNELDVIDVESYVYIMPWRYSPSPPLEDYLLRQHTVVVKWERSSQHPTS